PLQVSDVLPSKDTSVGTIGSASSYARSDRQHPIQTVDTIPVSDSANGSYGTVDSYARNDHSHPSNVQTNASIVPIVNGVRNNGTSAYYSGHDHIHPKQLTYDGNVTATKFIKSGETSNDILLVDGTTKKSVLANTRSGFSKLKFNQRWSNNTGISTYQYKFISSLTTGFNGAWIIYFDIALPTGYSVIYQLFLNSYGNMQINPSLRAGYDDGLRIARTIENTGSSSIELGCSRTSNSGAIQGQWVIHTPSSTATQAPQSFIIAVATQAAEDVTRGLQISIDGNTLKFNNNVLVDAETNQTINGIKTFSKLVQVNPSLNGTFNEGIRISRNSTNQWSNIQFGRYPNSNSGKIVNQWLVGSTGNNGANPLGFVIIKAGQEGQTDRGLQISADGSTLTFNGQVIAGGSVNYSQGNTILWGTKNTGTDGGFYTDGTTVFWRDHALQFDPYYQEQ
ncbi:MAG: hypothetical protein EZS28_042228, partial [Streblomastix strix]